MEASSVRVLGACNDLKTGRSTVKPLVTILIPTFNRPAHLITTLKSVLVQTHSNLEVIVQDNASEVDLTEAINQLHDPRVIYHRNEQNLGATKNFALGLSRAHGEFVGIVADDDLIAPTFVEKLVSPLINHPNATLSFCNIWITDETDAVDSAKTEQFNKYFGMHVIPEGYHPDCEVFALEYRAIAIVSGALLRRSAADWAAIPADISVHVSDLYHMYLAASTRKGCYYVPERLTYMSRSDNTLTASFAASLEAKIVSAREHLLYWTMIHRDPRLANRRYYHLKRAHYAALLTFYLTCAKRWKEAASVAWSSVKSGLFLPHSLVEHISYLLDIRSAGLERKLP
jgi:glycosyltransferase involved in cell wall biosynthesis